VNPKYFNDARAIRLVCIAVVLAFSYGVWYSYSVFLVALFEEFGWSRSTLALGFSVFAVVHGLSNPVVGRLCDKVNPASLVVYGGVGVSLSLLYVSTIETPAQLFFGFED
jgi:Sugar phosphate permease